MFCVCTSDMACSQTLHCTSAMSWLFWQERGPNLHGRESERQKWVSIWPQGLTNLQKNNVITIFKATVFKINSCLLNWSQGTIQKEKTGRMCFLFFLFKLKYKMNYFLDRDRLMHKKHVTNKHWRGPPLAFVNSIFLVYDIRQPLVPWIVLM